MRPDGIIASVETIGSWTTVFIVPRWDDVNNDYASSRCSLVAIEHASWVPEVGMGAWDTGSVVVLGANPPRAYDRYDRHKLRECRGPSHPSSVAQMQALP